MFAEVMNNTIESLKYGIFITNRVIYGVSGQCLSRNFRIGFLTGSSRGGETGSLCEVDEDAKSEDSEHE